MCKHSLLIVVLTLTAAPFRLAAETNVLRTTAEANAYLRTCIVRRAPCELSGTVLNTSTARPSLAQLAVLEDESGRTLINPKPPVCLHPGEIVTVRGFALTEPTLEHAIDITNATIRGHRDIRPVSVPLIRLDEERDDLRLVSTEGLVVDVFADEIDPDNIFFLLKDKSVILTVSQYGSRVPNEMLGSHVRVCGVYNRTASGRRKFTGPFIAADTVEVLQPPRSDAFDVPELENVIYLTPTQVAAMDSRKVSGTVLAVWGNDKLMLRDSYGRIVNAQLAAGVAAPACGSSIVLVGWPETDLFRLNLANARWKHADLPSQPDEAPDEDPTLDVYSHGRLVRMHGWLRGLPLPGSSNRRFHLDCGGQLLPVDLGIETSLPPDIVVGCELSVTGRILVNTETGRRHTISPRSNNPVLVIRSARDIKVLSYPPWWTPRRLMAVIGALLLAVIAVVAWNRLLRRLVERRSRELYRAEIDKATSELKVGERTRLAVELHDTLSQNLTGIALAINAGEYAIAQRSLKSCREELKNCLWDLRSNALSAEEMDDAIRCTLKPHIGKARLTVRFNASRRRFTDKTLHTILCIIRELTVNAIRHGHATDIRIAGSVEEGLLRFSVRDNGCGFDPSAVPTTDEGHFGLQGIRERVANFNGRLTLESEPGKGTKATICLELKC